MLSKHLVSIGCILVLTIAPLAATTTNLIGIVVGMEVKKNTRGDKSWTTYEVQLRNIWGFTRYSGVDDRILQLKITKGTFVLDGKRTTAEEAFKPGHLVKIMGDVDYYACYSDNFRFQEQVADSFGLDRGVYRLRLPNAASATYRYTGKPGKGEEIKDKAQRMDLSLHLLCRDGAVVVAAASQDAGKDGHRVFSLPINASKLRIVDGRLQGPITVTLLSQGRYLTTNESGSEERHFDIDATLGQASAEGTYTTGDASKALTITGSPEPVMGTDRSVVFYHSSGTGGNLGPKGAGETISLDARFVNGSLGNYYISAFPKGGPAHSKVTSYELTWDGPRFSGTIEIANPDNQRHSPAGTMHIEGVVIGDQLFGTTSSTFKGPDKEITGRLRGMILKPDAPPIIGWDEGMAKRWIEANKDSDEPMPDIMLK